MKTTKILSLAALLSVATWGEAQIKTPQPSVAATVSQSVGLGSVQVEYSRPALKGRKMFGVQEKYGKVWRTGANKVTRITFSEEMKVAGQNVPAGTYGLFSIPDANEWTIILNKDAEQWGAYTYKEADDVLRFKVKPAKTTSTVEYFTIEFTDFTPIKTNVNISWENVSVKFPIENNPDARIMADIKEKTSGANVSAGTYLAAANYYFDNNRELPQALEWADKALESQKQYWVYALHAKIAAKLNKCDLVAKDVESGLPLAEKANDNSYVLTLKKLGEDCKKGKK